MYAVPLYPYPCVFRALNGGTCSCRSLEQWCQDFFFGGPNFDSQKPWRAANSIASSSLLRSVATSLFSLSCGTHDRVGGCKSKIFPSRGLPCPLDETLVLHRGGEGNHIFQCGPRATTCGPRVTTQVRPASRAGRTSQLRGPHCNANFWTLGGPHFMASRATFGPRAALFTSLP